MQLQEEESGGDGKEATALNLNYEAVMKILAASEEELLDGSVCEGRVCLPNGVVVQLHTI